MEPTPDERLLPESSTAEMRGHRHRRHSHHRHGRKRTRNEKLIRAIGIVAFILLIILVGIYAWTFSDREEKAPQSAWPFAVGQTLA